MSTKRGKIWILGIVACVVSFACAFLWSSWANIIKGVEPVPIGKYGYRVVQVNGDYQLLGLIAPRRGVPLEEHLRLIAFHPKGTYITGYSMEHKYFLMDRRVGSGAEIFMSEQDWKQRLEWKGWKNPKMTHVTDLPSGDVPVGQFQAADGWVDF
jgi:hypothetical protein